MRNLYSFFMVSMKYSVYVLLAAAALSVASCSKNEVVPAPVPGGDAELAATEFMIKVSGDLAGRLAASAESVPGFDGLSVTRTFPDGGIYEGRMKKAGLDRWFTVSGTQRMSLTKAGEFFSGIDGVELVESNPGMKVSEIGWNDPGVGKQWYLVNNGNALKGYLPGCDISVEKVWERGVVGSDNVVVAVIDQGVDLEHEDLVDALWSETIDGKVVHGRNFFNDNFQITAGDHGTHVAGVIGAVSNNGIGISGIAGGDAAKGIRGVRIMSCQIMSETKNNGNGAEAMVWAANHGAVICQNSWSYDLKLNPDLKDTPQYMKDAINYFNTYAGCDEDGNQLPGSPVKGGVVIFAAGNESASVSYPAMYEGCIAVGSVSADYAPAYYTNFGDWVDIAAPGGDSKKGHLIYSSVINNSYDGFQGTSMACPMVSGVAALILSEYGGQGFTREMLVDRLLKTARRIDFGKAIGGLVSAEDALAHYDGHKSPVPAIAGFKNASATSVEVEVSVPEPDGDVFCRSIKLYYDRKAFSKPADAGFCVSQSTEGYEAGDAISIKLDGLESGAVYHFAAVGYDAMSRPSVMSQSRDAKIEKNTAPSIKAETGTSVTLKKHESAAIVFAVEDRDGDEVECRLEAESKDGISLSFDGKKATVSVNALLAKVGTVKGKLVARDSNNAETAADFTVTILENHAPELSGSFEDVIASLGNAPVTLDLRRYFSDQDGETLSYKVTVDSGNSPCTSDVKDGMLTISGKNAGQASITVEASDASNAGVRASFRYLCRDDKEVLDAYPVPVVSTLSLRASAPFTAEVRLYNATGACVLTETVSSEPFAPAVIDLASLRPGSYVLSTEINGETVKKTIVKK